MTNTDERAETGNTNWQQPRLRQGNARRVVALA